MTICAVPCCTPGACREVKKLTVPFATSLLLLLFLGGCGPDDPVLAKVGDTEITASQLDVFVGRVSLDLLSDEEGVEADRDYLESMIDQELLVQEARSRGLDTSSVVTHQLEAAVRHRFYQRYLGEFVNPKIAITPTEIERAFHDMGFDRERLVSRILLNGTEMEARAVLAQIEEGRPFADVLEEHGDSDPLADDSGKISWVGVTSLKKLRIPPDEFRSLSLNEPLLIKLSPGVWGIVRFEEDREANIQHYQGDLIKILRQEEWWRRTNEEAEVLGQKYGARSHPEGLQALIQRHSERRGDLTEEEAAQPLHSFADGDTITAGDFIVRVREEMGNSAVGDSSMIVHVAENRLLFPKLFLLAAHDLGWDQEEGFFEWRDRKHRSFMMLLLVKTEVDDRISFSEKQMRDYYEHNQEEFRAGEVLHVQEVHATADSTVRRWRAEIEAGGSRSPYSSPPAASPPSTAIAASGMRSFRPSSTTCWASHSTARTSGEAIWTPVTSPSRPVWDGAPTRRSFTTASPSSTTFTSSTAATLTTGTPTTGPSTCGWPSIWASRSYATIGRRRA